MIFASQRGGEVACRLYSLVLSANQAGINVQEYFEDLLVKLVKIGITPASQIASLTPWGWAKKRAAIDES